MWHEAGGDYTVEHRDGGPERHFQVTVGEPEPVIAAMTGWARQEHEWGLGLDWAPLDLGPAPDPAPPLDLDDDTRERLETRLHEVLAGGYATRAQRVELVSGEHRPVSREQAWQLVDRMWLERVEEQAAWQGETDPERLARAFAALEQAGITAREDFACCRSCGDAEIGTAGAADARGFVYFHSQCTDAATRGHGLTLLYGTFDGSTATSIGREVVTALEESGLSVEWNGDPLRAVTVTPLDWRKRLVG
ncbi:DUF6891 domain-containing protein [Nonomuraea jabiensis]|uniref:DUF6891 domain-containing protein n=1 Tax=Nonomuraea jabiensis TaxID=882448 RepID=A0A7W9GEF6_9ACTN|nr:hypothetical protein [Nonomuraea jabiensis]MBB5782328.1 hypothetical protein [Nonomuraea jabiensis]